MSTTLCAVFQLSLHRKKHSFSSARHINLSWNYCIIDRITNILTLGEFNTFKYVSPLTAILIMMYPCSPFLLEVGNETCIMADRIEPWMMYPKVYWIPYVAHTKPFSHLGIFHLHLDTSFSSIDHKFVHILTD